MKKTDSSLCILVLLAACGVASGEREQIGDGSPAGFQDSVTAGETGPEDGGGGGHDGPADSQDAAPRTQTLSDTGLQDTPADSQGDMTVSRYCEKFARAWCRNNAIHYTEASATTKKKSDIMRRLSNAFQPQDSQFTAGYDCHFLAGKEDGQAHRISVAILLTGTLDFAHYTKWEKLQIIPVAYVVDESNDRAGYGVFKYLKKP